MRGLSRPSHRRPTAAAAPPGRLLSSRVVAEAPAAAAGDDDAVQKVERDGAASCQQSQADQYSSSK